MILNTEYSPCPIDLEDSINDYNANLTKESPLINQPYVNEKHMEGDEMKIESNDPIYVMTVELGDGNSEAIRIYCDSNPEELSYNFCKVHNLDFQSMNYLNSQLIGLLEQFRKGPDMDGINSIQEVDEEDYVSDRIRTCKMNKSNNPSQVHQNMNENSTHEEKNIKNKEYLSNLSNNLVNFNVNNNDILNTNIDNIEKIHPNSFIKSDKVNKIENKNLISNSGKNICSKIETNVMKSNLYKNLKSKTEIKILENQSRNFHTNENKPDMNKSKTKSANLFTYEIYENENKTKQDKTDYNSNNTKLKKSKNSQTQCKSNITQEKSQKNSNDNLKTNLKPIDDKKFNKSTKNIFERLYQNSCYRKLGFFNIDSLSHHSSKQHQNFDNPTHSSILNSNSNNLGLAHKNYLSDHKSTINSNCTINLDQILQPISPINRSLIKSHKKHSNPKSINYGERLYQRNMKLQEETRRKLEFFKKIQEDEYNNQFKYKPRINSKSADIIRKRYEDKIIKMLNADINSENNNNNFSDLLNKNDSSYFLPGWLENISNYNLYVEDKLEKLRKKYEKFEEFPFAPEINKNSKQIAEEKLKSKLFFQLQEKTTENSKLESIILKNARIEELYDQWRIRPLKINKLSDNIYSQYTFKPNLNNNRFNSEILNLPFDQRQEFFKKKIEDKINKLDKMSYNYNTEKVRSKSSNNNNNRSNNTNSKSTKNNRHTSNIFFNLYSLAEKYSRDKHNRAKLAENEVIKNMQCVHTLAPSEHMIQKMKEESFQKIFNFMDQDEDNVISSFYINTNKLDKEILRILQPILIELKEEQETLNEDEFVRACMYLYEMLDYVDRRALLDFGKKSDGNKSNESLGYDFTFKPTIDKKSRKIAESKFLTFDSNRNLNEREEMSYSNLIKSLNKTTGRY